MASECTRTDCTVADTGTCLLNNDPSFCPHRLAVEGSDAGGDTEVERTNKSTIPSSRACTLGDAKKLMRERYVHLVAILGEPDAGKTGCLVSLYLSVAHAKLDGFSFADSRTLMGFEEISQGARRWNGGRAPEQFTEHTALEDERTAGFLHMKMNRNQHGKPVDLLCSDLPGEWTTDLIERNRTDRLQFVNRADAIWLVIDGRETVDPEKRQVCLHRSKMVLRRLGTFLVPGRRLILVVTRRDVVVPSNSVVREICDEGRNCGFETECVSVASFAQDDAKVPAGTGIARLIERTTGFGCAPTVVWQKDDSVDASFEVPSIGLRRRGPHEP